MLQRRSLEQVLTLAMANETKGKSYKIAPKDA